MTLIQDLQNILKKYWGFDDFRENQIPIITSIAEKKDTLAIMSTGGGKSICFQIPALYLDGMCIVISPLIALMTDQIKRLKELGIRAEAIHSGLAEEEQNSCLLSAKEGLLKLLYISPERLQSQKFVAHLKEMQLSFIAVDEAHCISQYGHDFRPSYREISKIREWKEDLPIVALTATATNSVAEDISQNLGLRKPKIIKFSSRRENLAYQIFKIENKRGLLLQIIKAHAGSSGIIYARNRRLVSELAQFLKKRAIKVAYYHAGLSSEKKDEILNHWIQNDFQVVVATNAFGMGIDKSDVRFVIHYDLAPSLEEYVQEAGRAGRDGKASSAITLFNKADCDKKLKDIEKSYPSREYLKRTYKSISTYLNLAEGEIQRNPSPFNLIEFCNHYKVNPLTVYHALSRLEDANLLTLSSSFYSPSTLHFPVDFVNQLNNLQLQSKSEEIIRNCIRLYDGVIYKHVKISEENISKHSHCTLPEVKQTFKSLAQKGYISYQEQNDFPKIKILGPRRNSKRLTISKEILEDKKQRALKHIHSLFSYLEEKECRQKFIDSYFGDENEKVCGICDICISKKQQGGQSDYSFLKEKISTLLSKQNMSIENLMIHFNQESKTDIIQLLQRMADEDFITIVDDLIILNK